MMQSFYLSLDKIAVGVIFFGALALIALMKNYSKGGRIAFSFSAVSFFPREKNWRERFTKLPDQFLIAALISFLLAFGDPHLMILKSKDSNISTHKNQPHPKEGIAIYLVLDQSGSMREPVLSTDVIEKKEHISKIDLMKTISKLFILGSADLKLQGRDSDLIGLISFARVPQVLSPLTLDKQAIVEELDKIEPINNDSDNGTAIGYAIFKTAHLIASTKYFAEKVKKNEEPSYSIKSTIMIVVTDGFQNPNPLDKGNRLRTVKLEEAAQFAHSHGIRLYIINIDPRFSDEAFAPHFRLMKKITEMTGGKFYMIDKASDLHEIYSDIDQLEKSAIPEFQNPATNDDTQNQYRRSSLFPILISFGMLCLFFSALLQTTLLRKIP